MTLVSVIIPCFDREDTVEEAIRSVLDQSWSALEVIAVDDGSTDRSWEMMERIDDPRLRLVRNPGKGVSQARNHGVSLAQGTWIAFQDSDDVWMPQKLARQMARLSDSECVAAYCGMIVKEDTDPATPVQARFPGSDIDPREGDILPSLLRSSYLSTQMLVIRRDVFDRVGGFDPELQALVDWDLMLRVAQEGPVAFVDEDLVVQRMSPNSITRSSHKRLMAHRRILEKYSSLLQGNPDLLGFHHHRLAGAYRLAGDFATAARHAGSALRARPANLKYAANLVYLRARSLLS